MDANEFDNIRPYTDEETVAAMERIARHPMLPVISKYLFPDEPVGTLSKKLLSIHSTDEFQDQVMIEIVALIVRNSSAGFTCSGMEHLESLGERSFLAISNHRDIVLDPALVQYVMYSTGRPYTQICVGSNLLSSWLIEDLMRCNRMIKVIRGISARQLYLSSQNLSRYIRETITSNTAPIWIAQREGRTKNGLDSTEQGLLKMFDMSGKGTFEENFRELNILPMSISYEYEPCDSRKARETLLRREGPYTKKPKEDLHSILTGIRQQKGHIHLAFGAPLSEEEIAEAARADKNERYQTIRHILDRRIIGGYKLWKTNYIAHDMLHGRSEYLKEGFYTEADREEFDDYIAHKLGKLEWRLDHAALRYLFLNIYAGPVDSKKEL